MTVKRNKTYIYQGKRYVDLRSHELNHAYNNGEDIEIVTPKGSMTIPHKDLKPENFKQIGKNKDKWYYCSYPEEKYNLKVGDRYQLYSYELPQEPDNQTSLF